MGAAGSRSDEVLPHGGEDVQQDAGLGADAAVLHAVLFQNGIPCPHSVGHAVHREIERTRHHIGDLGVGVVMQCAHGPLFEGVLHTHQAVGVGQHPAGDALACRLRQSLCMLDPALFLLGKLHIHSSFSAAGQRLFLLL